MVNHNLCYHEFALSNASLTHTHTWHQCHISSPVLFWLINKFSLAFVSIRYVLQRGSGYNVTCVIMLYKNSLAGDWILLNSDRKKGEWAELAKQYNKVIGVTNRIRMRLRGEEVFLGLCKLERLEVRRTRCVCFTFISDGFLNKNKPKKHNQTCSIFVKRAPLPFLFPFRSLRLFQLIPCQSISFHLWHLSSRHS